MFNANMPSLSDIAAVTGNDRDGGWGGAYMVSFHANVTGATAATPVQLALALGGDVMPETTMIFTPETANTVGQVSICLPVFNSCCDYDRVTVVNTGTTDIVVSANPMLAISKMCG